MKKRKQLVVVTRAKADNSDLVKKIKAGGMRTYEFPTIEISPKKLTPKDKEKLKNISRYDAIIFTSTHAIEIFHRNRNRNKKMLNAGTAIIAIGEATARAARQKGMKVAWTPKQATSAAIAKEIPKKYSKILIPASAIASNDLPKSLRKRRFKVALVDMYTTTYVTAPDMRFNGLIKTDRVDYLTFASPSSIVGFSKRLKNATLLNKARNIKTVCIGTTTAQAAREMRFKKIVVAKQFSTAGIISALL